MSLVIETNGLRLTELFYQEHVSGRKPTHVLNFIPGPCLDAEDFISKLASLPHDRRVVFDLINYTAGNLGVDRGFALEYPTTILAGAMFWDPQRKEILEVQSIRLNPGMVRGMMNWIEYICQPWEKARVRPLSLTDQDQRRYQDLRDFLSTL